MDGYGRKILCRVKPYEGDIPKIRGLRQGNGQVWPHILGMSTTIRLLSIVKNEANVIINDY
jgi:hypothetical protein